MIYMMTLQAWRECRRMATCCIMIAGKLHPVHRPMSVAIKQLDLELTIVSL